MRTRQQRKQLHHVYRVCRLADSFRRMDNLETILPIVGKRVLSMAKRWEAVVVDDGHIALTEFGYHLARAENRRDIETSMEIPMLLSPGWSGVEPETDLGTLACEPRWGG